MDARRDTREEARSADEASVPKRTRVARCLKEIARRAVITTPQWKDVGKDDPSLAGRPDN